LLVFIVFFCLFGGLKKYFTINTHAIKATNNNKITYIHDDDLSFLIELNKTLLIDCRDESLYLLKHARGSLNITLKMIEDDPVGVRNRIFNERKQKLVIYCSGNMCDTSSKVATYLAFTNLDVRVYKAGWHTLKNVVEYESVDP
jgi:rhodanese-related sulfurtransferase